MQTGFNPNIQPYVQHRKNRSLYRNCLKRVMDFTLSLLAIIVLSPIFLIVAFLVKVKLGSPVIFQQKRPGLNEKLFTIYKFRTMTDERDGSGQLLSDCVRLTKFGRFLRSTSLDELPELFNILIGDMSIVGPRPLLVKDLVFMTNEQRIRHTVRPGLSGLAQVNGRNDVIWEDKLSLDLEYVKNLSLIGDCKIIGMTLGKVFIREGINTTGMDTAEDYGDYLLRKQRISVGEYRACIKECKELLNDI